MKDMHRRNFLQWIGAVIAAIFVRPASSIASNLPSIPPAKSTVSRIHKFTTEQFESGELSLDSAESTPLLAMLQDLHDRRQYDSDCHDGEPGPHFDYLTGWINDVSRELKARGHEIEP